ncbi:tetratricopeptide repeat protein [Anaerocolumna chitinilytica]|uniref:Tetratricopeptide repeat protein n=1 Tax=Anaerocolumna chitinilytica TaxID=1727145 RepID=A0A7I8DQ86_9FIRM|nr:hypothetical protein [Anaerocolumna chitinilytica]BCJ99827.1 hypothetical protein bsdcttw_28680 [Anaerocolumna chitinilytica]
MKSELEEKYHYLYENLQKAPLKELKEFVKAWEVSENKKDTPYFSPNHLLELYIYEYKVQGEKFEILDWKLHLIYRELAERYTKKDDLAMALSYYEKALDFNPVDVEVIYGLAHLYRNSGNFDMLYQTAVRMYPFCYTRSDMSKYYRLLGMFYLETYQPELAEALYEYSEYYYPNEVASKEIEFLEKALKRKHQEREISELQEILKKKSIPVIPRQETMGLLYKTAQLELGRNNTEYARFLFLFLYQLTGDEEAGEILTRLGHPVK